MPAISQCPKCELLFAIRTQLDDHLAQDHPGFRHQYVPSSARESTAAPSQEPRGGGAAEGVVERTAATTNGSAAASGGAPVAPPGNGVRHVLVVANQTLGGTELLDRVRARMAEGPCDFSILVPATPQGGSGVTAPAAGTPGTDAGSSPDADPRTPQLRLDAARSRFARLGATVDGRVSDPDPLRAVEKAMARAPYDEVIISTLARGNSRWWRQDLPTKVQKRFHKPVTVISAGVDSA